MAKKKVVKKSKKLDLSFKAGIGRMKKAGYEVTVGNFKRGAKIAKAFVPGLGLIPKEAKQVFNSLPAPVKKKIRIAKRKK